MLDGVVLARKTGAGALRRPVLVALGLRQDGKKEVIDFRLARGESAAEWERFLDDLYKRGLAGEGLDMICVDGGSGLSATLPRVPRPALLGPQDPQHSQQGPQGRPDRRQGRSACGDERRGRTQGALGRPPLRRALGPSPPRRSHLPARRSRRASHLLPLQDARRAKAVRTTNAIERRFPEVRRRTRPMGVFQDTTSIDRILFAVFTHENKIQGIPTLLSPTHNL